MLLTCLAFLAVSCLEDILSTHLTSSTVAAGPAALALRAHGHNEGRPTPLVHSTHSSHSDKEEVLPSAKGALTL